MLSTVTGADGTAGSKTAPALMGLPVESGQTDKRASKKKESHVMRKSAHCSLGVGISGKGHAYVPVYAAACVSNVSTSGTHG